jgi:hypothetical protein
MRVKNFFCNKFILVILVVQIICGFSLFAMSKAPDSVEGLVKVYGNEPHTYLGIETQDGKIFILKAEEEILSELQKQQGYLLKLSGKIIEAKSKSLFDKDQFEVVEWSKVLDSE